MQNLNAIPLSALRAVEAIARTGTLVRAAAELGVTAGALSQRLTKAEAVLGQPLFIRSASGLKPTDSCAAVAQQLTKAISDLSIVVSKLRQTDDAVLSVSVTPIFASRWLIWRIRKFNELNPAIRVRIEPTVEVVDLNRSEMDVGIRFSSNPDMGIGATKLLDQRVFPVCSHEIAQHIKTPRDLLNHPIIRENERLNGWDVWLSEHDLSVTSLKPGPTYGDASLCLDAAMTGQGIFMAWETLACDALERGQLAAPIRQRSMTGATYWFATSKFSAQKPSVRKFRNWLEAELECSVRNWRKTGA
ncbi:MAG: LysR substrate-binding domain-containing protein [Rhodobacteraceae bacterium]|jgi:LysR family transcriptional regulator, glycine cleavage system transcriptional activator|nr:LysR substrate-binding domain-containing protein [Paracoccaceae bacterium]